MSLDSMSFKSAFFVCLEHNFEYIARYDTEKKREWAHWLKILLIFAMSISTVKSIFAEKLFFSLQIRDPHNTRLKTLLRN